MVEKSRPRGRPRAYDPDTALDCAAELFWAKGFAGTSLDDLSAAMGMGRPSIYKAFGDKHALFLRALERYRDTVGARPLQALEEVDSIDDAIDGFFRQLVKSYTDSSHLGCLMGSVAAVTDDAEVRRFLTRGLAWEETQIAGRLSRAVSDGQLPSDYSPTEGARQAVSAMLSLAVRARIGASRRVLLKDAAAATATVLGPRPEPPHRGKASREQRDKSTERPRSTTR